MVHLIVETGFLKTVNSVRLQGVFGRNFILSRFGWVAKVRIGELNRRLILVKEGTRKVH